MSWLALAAALTVLSDGHVDYAARLVDGQLQAVVKDGTAGPEHVVWRDPATVVFALGDNARTTIPTTPQLRFLGVPGAPVWLIPQVQQPGVLWAGWNTEELTAAQVAGPVRWTLAAVDGPGTVAVFQTGAFGDVDVVFDSADGLPDTREIPLGTHAHGTWTFSQPGRYRLTFTTAATAATGAPLADTRTLAVTVGPTTPRAGGVAHRVGAAVTLRPKDRP
jgi:putative ABC transporter-associated repeat protein